MSWTEILYLCLDLIIHLILSPVAKDFTVPSFTNQWSDFQPIQCCYSFVRSNKKVNPLINKSAIKLIVTVKKKNRLRLGDRVILGRESDPLRTGSQRVLLRRDIWAETANALWSWCDAVVNLRLSAMPIDVKNIAAQTLCYCPIPFPLLLWWPGWLTFWL